MTTRNERLNALHQTLLCCEDGLTISTICFIALKGSEIRESCHLQVVVNHACRINQDDFAFHFKGMQQLFFHKKEALDAIILVVHAGPQVPAKLWHMAFRCWAFRGDLGMSG